MQNELLWMFIVIFAIDSIAPGPAVAMVMSRGASIGLKKTLPFIAGLVIGDLLLFVAALLGLVAMAEALGPLFWVIKWLGIVYLLHLAINLWTADPSQLQAYPSNNQGWRSFGLALILPLGNPKAVGFYVALLPSFMNIQNLSITTAAEFSLSIVLIWGAVLVFYTALADQGRRYLKSNSALKWLNRGAAGAMVGAAGTIAFRE